MMKSCFLAFFGLIAVRMCGQVQMPATTRVAVESIQKLAALHPDAKALVAAGQGQFPMALTGGRCTVGFLARVHPSFDAQGLNPEAVTVGARRGNIVSMRVDAYHLGSVAAMLGVEYIEMAGKVVPDLHKAVVATRADSVHAGIFLPQSYRGTDVLIGITDWGFDYTHPMFYDTTLTFTRIRAAWDQYKQSGPAPQGYTYGTAYLDAPSLMAAESDTANIYSYHTHGTHVAGIAGGSGAGTNYRGFAHTSQLIFTTFLVDAAAVFDAFEWMQSIAEADQKRLVISMSWGLHHFGTLDGQSLLSQVINTMSDEGVVFVTSGGNNGNVTFHIKKEFNNDTIRSKVQFYSYNANPSMWGQSLSMWGEPGKSFSAGFDITTPFNSLLQESPWYHTATQDYYLDSMLVQGSDTVFFNLTSEAAHPLNGRPFFRLRIKNTNTQLSIVMKATADVGTVHFHNVTELTNDVGNWGQAFQAPIPAYVAGDSQYGVGEPACTESAIAVAAYNAEALNPSGTMWVNGEIASFSSKGPTIDGRIKPDIAAPGVSVTSSISSFTNANYTSVQNISFQGNTYPFAKFSGTSMSAPAVSGIVAMMLEADPTLTPAEVREILMLTARTDNHTGAIPIGGSVQWGAGKVNAYAAVREVLGLNGVPETPWNQIMVWPNPTNGMLHVMLPEGPGQIGMEIIDLSSRVVMSQSAAAQGLVNMDLTDLGAGVYILKITSSSKNKTVKIVKQ